MSTPIRQHLIDPEICIRCGTCEETCPIDAVTHNDDNYVVDAEVCNACLDCISPCPTGAIDNWRIVDTPYSLDEQYSWDELPEQKEDVVLDPASPPAGEASEDEVVRLLEQAHAGAGGKARPPASASSPYVNLYTRTEPAVAKVAGNFRLTDAEAESEIHHIVLDFGRQSFPVLEGQSIGILPPGTDARGRPHHVRLYSVASPRDGERPNHNNLSLTVKREVFVNADGERREGVASSYLCDVKKGEEVQVTGPFGSTFLMPNEADANIIMVCTGTGSAPFRAMTERRRRQGGRGGKLLLFFGARTPGELPYFGPLMKLPDSLIQKELCFSRLADQPKEYVQDRMRRLGKDVAELLRDERTHLYVCGLKGMEAGVAESLESLCREAGLDWKSLAGVMRDGGRYHVETY